MTVEAALRALGGGALIGLAAAMIFVLHGRIAGVSGMIGRALEQDGGSRMRLAFLAGLVSAGAVASQITPGAFGTPRYGLAVVAIAGLLVGFGTTLGNGCTSGHGVCGIARGSRRSVIAVLVFITTGVITVAVAGALS